MSNHSAPQLAAFYRWLLYIPANLYPLITILGKSSTYGGSRRVFIALHFPEFPERFMEVPASAVSPPYTLLCRCWPRVIILIELSLYVRPALPKLLTDGFTKPAPRDGRRSSSASRTKSQRVSPDYLDNTFLGLHYRLSWTSTWLWSPITAPTLGPHS